MENIDMDQQSIMDRHKAPHMGDFAVETTAADHNFFEKDLLELYRKKNTVAKLLIEQRELHKEQVKLLCEQKEEYILLSAKCNSKMKERIDLQRKKVAYRKNQEAHLSTININELSIQDKMKEEKRKRIISALVSGIDTSLLPLENEIQELNKKVEDDQSLIKLMEDKCIQHSFNMNSLQKDYNLVLLLLRLEEQTKQPEISVIQEEESIELFMTEEIKYFSVKPKVVKFEDTYKLSQQLVFVDTKTVEIEDEEIIEMDQVHTVSEQASVQIQLDECMEECSLSKPTVFKQQVYKEVNMEEEELKDLEEFTSKPETANFKIQADPLKRISAITEVIIQNNVNEGENEELIKTQVKNMSKEVSVLKQDEEDLQKLVKVQDIAVQELITSFKQNKITEERFH